MSICVKFTLSQGPGLSSIYVTHSERACCRCSGEYLLLVAREVSQSAASTVLLQEEDWRLFAANFAGQNQQPLLEISIPYKATDFPGDSERTPSANGIYTSAVSTLRQYPCQNLLLKVCRGTTIVSILYGSQTPVGPLPRSGGARAGIFNMRSAGRAGNPAANSILGLAVVGEERRKRQRSDLGDLHESSCYVVNFVREKG